MDYFILFLAWIAVGVILLFVGLFMGLKADREWRSQAQYYPVSPLKFIILNFVTIDFYILFWFWKNWRFIADRNNRPIKPLARTFFSPIFFYPLLKDIKNHSPGGKQMPGFLMGLLTVFYILLSLWGGIYFRMDGPAPAALVLVGTFGFTLVLLPVVLAINSLNERHGIPLEKNSRFGPVSILGVLVGAPLATLFLLTETHFLPGDYLYSPEYLWQKDINFIAETGQFEEGEEMIYFFSTGFYSIEEDGNVLTNKEVLSYYQDEQGDTILDYAFFEEITLLQIDYSDSWDEFSLLEINWGEGNYFYLFLPTERKEAKKFLDQLENLSGKNVEVTELDFY